MMMLNEKTKAIQEHISGIIEFSDRELDMIDRAIREIHEECPTDVPLLVKKSQSLILAGDDLYWVINVISRKHARMKSDIYRLKDPKFTALSRGGRPSSAAIEAEIRFTTDGVYKMEEDYENIGSLLDYLRVLSSMLDKYSWIIKDKLGVAKL